MDGRIDIVEIPLIGGELAVGVHVPFAQEQHQLILRETRVQGRERHHVKREIPGRVPRIFPLVGHRQHVAVEEMGPVVIAAVLAVLRGRGLRGIALQPGCDNVLVKLLGPEQAGVSLPRHLLLSLG